MAEQNDRSKDDLTEEPSQFRIEEYRKKGQVAQSRELTGIVALAATATATYMMAPRIGQDISEFMREVFRTDLSARADLGATHVLSGYLIRAVQIGTIAGVPICMAGFVFGVLGSFGQIGSIFSTDPLAPDLGKLNPLQGLQKIFSKRTLIEGARLIFKMVVALWVAYALVKSEVFDAPNQMSADPFQALSAYGHSAKTIFFSLTAVMTLFALADFIFQRMEFSKNLRMTKQEAKQEHKEREGDPQIKARIRAVQREVARKRMMQAVKKADVIVTNPTHIAIAIKYEKEKMFAPRVVAKGADFVAQKIKAVASEAGIPMVENVPLARTLYKTVKVGQYVPRALYQAVAEVLAYVYRLKGKPEALPRKDKV